MRSSIPSRNFGCGFRAKRATRAAVSLSLALTLGALVGGCARAPVSSTTPRADEAPPTLLPVGALSGEFMMRQRVTARYGAREDGFDAVLQKRGGELALVGLGPMGSLAFVLTLSERGVEVDNRTGREVPFRPDHILADVQRVFYPWLDGRPRCDGQPDVGSPTCEGATREGDAADYHITERFARGRLVERRFRLREAPARGDIVVMYQRWAESALAPRRVVLRNPAHGYELIIDTLDVTEITAGAAAP